MVRSKAHIYNATLTSVDASLPASLDYGKIIWPQILKKHIMDILLSHAVSLTPTEGRIFCLQQQTPSGPVFRGKLLNSPSYLWNTQN